MGYLAKENPRKPGQFSTPLAFNHLKVQNISTPCPKEANELSSPLDCDLISYSDEHHKSPARAAPTPPRVLRIRMPGLGNFHHCTLPAPRPAEARGALGPTQVLLTWPTTYASIWGRMNTHVPPILMFTRGTRFWPIAKSRYVAIGQSPVPTSCEHPNPH